MILLGAYVTRFFLGAIFDPDAFLALRKDTLRRVRPLFVRFMASFPAGIAPDFCARCLSRVVDPLRQAAQSKQDATKDSRECSAARNFMLGGRSCLSPLVSPF